VRDELNARDKQLGDTVAETEKLREDQHSLKGEVEDRGSAIVTLQTELEKVRGEVLERDDAIAKLKSELEAREDKQLNLFPPTPTPTPEPEPTPEPTTPPEPIPTTGTLSRAELAKHILEKFPDSKMNPQKITDAIRDRDKGNGASRLSVFEQDYSFKFVGKIGKENRFQLV